MLIFCLLSNLAIDSLFKLWVGASIKLKIKSVEKMSKTVKNLSKRISIKGNDHLSIYAYESSMKLSFGGTLDTRTACGALKKIKEFYMKRNKTFEYKTNMY